MSTGLSKLFNIEKEEKTIVSVLLLQSVFLGFFAGAFDVGAHSLFLKAFDASLIPGAFVLSGIVGILITSVYTSLQRSMKFSSFMLVAFGFVAVTTLLLRVGFIFSDSDKLIYIVFVLMGPLTIVSFLGFWGNVSRIFSLRQGKRLFGMIDTGQIIGIIISSYAIPVMMSFKFSILDTLLISSASIFVALLIQIFISRRAHFSEVALPKIKKEAIGAGFINLFKVRYTRLIAFFVLFSVIAAFFVHYSFISVTQINYPEPENLASFLGAFMGTLMVFTIIIKTFLYSKLMKTYGLRFALLITPVLLGIFSFIALTAGGLYGLDKGTAGFTLFFLLMALSKLFVKSLKDSIEVPSSKILYQSIHQDIRYDVQSRIDGTINEISAFFSGLVLAGLGLIAVINLLHYSAVLIIVIILWLITGVMLYKSYRGSLYEALKRFRESDEADLSVTKDDKSYFDNLAGSKLFYSLKYLPQLWNGFFSGKMEKLINNPDKRIKEETEILIDRLGVPDEELKTSLTLADESGGKPKYKEKDIKEVTDDTEIKALLNSSDSSDRKRAIFLVSRSKDKKLHTRLIPLYRDFDPAVRASAIRSTGYAGNKDIVHYLVDLIEDPNYYSSAFHALVKVGPAAIDTLENAFYKTGISGKSLKRITRAIASIDSPDKIPLLLSKLDHPNIGVVSEALKGLTDSEFRPSASDLAKLIPNLRKIVDMAARNFALLVSLRTYLPDSELTKAINEEYHDNIDMIFSFLSLAYDRQSIYHIRQNYESGTAEGIGFAIELLSLFIDESINPFLFPLFEDNADTEKVKNLQAEYPVDIEKMPDVLFTIINSSLNQIGYYARVCALNEFLAIKDFEITRDIIAQAFHPNDAVREAALLVINKNNPELLPDILKRSEYEWNMNAETGSNDYNQESEVKKIEILSQMQTFSSVKRKHLTEFASHFHLAFVSESQKRNVLETFKSSDVVLIVKGTVLIENSKGDNIEFGEDDIFPVSEILRLCGRDCFITTKGDVSCLKISDDRLRELFFDFGNASSLIIEKMVRLNDNAEIILK